MSRQADAVHHIYELYAADGTCLYVGCTVSLARRLAAHTNKPWWPEVARIETNAYANFETGRAAERQRIRQLTPEYNQQDNPIWEAQHPKPWEIRSARRRARHEAGEMCSSGWGCRQCGQRHSAELFRSRGFLLDEVSVADRSP
jgi:hypothetical protein